MDKNIYSEPLYMHYFTNEEDFPFFIQDGHHDNFFKWHHHGDFVELIIVLEGTAMHKVNDKSYFIKRGDVFALADGVSHNFLDAHQLHICNIMFRMPDLLNNSPDLKTIPGFHALFVIEPHLSQNHEFQSYLKLDFQEFEYAQQLIHLIFQEYYANRPGRKTVVLSLFHVLVAHLSRCYKLPDDNPLLCSSIRIAHSVSYMEKNFQTEHTVQELAKISNLSVRHFSRLFTETYHTSPKNYIAHLRLQYACKLLEDTSKTMTITEIAYQSGFQSSNYFARLFHQTYGLTPGEYRNQQKGQFF